MAKKNYGKKAGAKAATKASKASVKGKTVIRTSKDLVPSSIQEAFKNGGKVSKKSGKAKQAYDFQYGTAKRNTGSKKENVTVRTSKDLVASSKAEAFKYGGGVRKKPVNDFFEKMKCGGLSHKK